MDLAVRATVLLAIAALAFGLSVRLGILIGRRLDGGLEGGPRPADPEPEGATMEADPGNQVDLPGSPVHGGLYARTSARPARRTRGE
jgi:hypothetical protein